MALAGPLFFMEWIKRFCGCIYHFSISVTLVVLQRQKSLPDIDGTTKMSATSLWCGLPWSLASTPWAMILQISCNIFLAFKWILMMTWGQHTSHYTTAKLSFHVWNNDLIWWQSKIDAQKHFRKTTITSSWTLSKTIIPITIVRAQMPSNPNKKSRTRDDKGWIVVSAEHYGADYIPLDSSHRKLVKWNIFKSSQAQDRISLFNKSMIFNSSGLCELSDWSTGAALAWRVFSSQNNCIIMKGLKIGHKIFMIIWCNLRHILGKAWSWYMLKIWNTN